MLTKVNGTNSSSFTYEEIFNSSTVNFTNVVETKKYLFMTEKEQKLYAIPKQSNYVAKAMTTADVFKNKSHVNQTIVNIAATKYNTDFPSVGHSSHIVAVVDVKGDKTAYSLIPLSLSKIEIKCHPLTSLLCFWSNEETQKIKFLIMGVNDEFAHVPEIRFTFNVYNIYNYGKVGTMFWLLIMLYSVTVLAVFSYRMLRLAFKRKAQLKRIDGIKKMIHKGSSHKALLSDKSSLIAVQQEEEAQRRKHAITMELTGATLTL